jgi:hypothetical protein
MGQYLFCWTILILRCAKTAQKHQGKMYLRYSHVNLYKLNTEKTTTLRGGYLLVIGDRRAYQQTRLLQRINSAIV